tara:strand:+ start:375 stop:1019 length:645 start_codon:yes stop_codon:yes gene_type:complete
MKVKITQPTSLKDIKLSQYQKFVRTTKDSEDNNFVTRQMISIFCNVPDKVVGQIKASDYDSIVADLTKVLELKPEFVPTFKLDGVEYGFIPELEDITVDEKADLDTFYKDIDTMDKAMAVLYRPITLKRGKKYLIEDYEGENGSLDVTLDIVLGANVFFSLLMTDLLNYTQSYIAQEVEHNPKVSQILEQNGVGSTAFINSLQETFLSLTKLVS